MIKMRVTIQPKYDDPADDLRAAARVRRDLWAHSAVEIAPDSRRHGTHRDADGRAYFEFATDYPDEVRRVLDKFGHASRTVISIVNEEEGPECANCGNVAGPILPCVCPSCGFRDISPCPHCHEPVPRQKYLPVSGDLFQCPNCKSRVRLHMHDPLFNGDGRYNEPLVVVESAEECSRAL